ncbi:hypothetical protein GCM10020256_00160 [Streptomyces thermocoprophilus]
MVAADRMSRHLSNLISGQDVVLPRRTRQSSPWEGRFLQNVSLRTAKGRRDVIGLLRAGRPLLLLFGEADGSHLAQAQHWSQVVGTVRAEPTPRSHARRCCCGRTDTSPGPPGRAGTAFRTRWSCTSAPARAGPCSSRPWRGRGALS